MVTDAADLGCSPTITSNRPGGITPCWSAGCSNIGLCAFSDVQSLFYWSASSFVSVPTFAWDIDMINGNVGTASKTSIVFVWPVRGGQ